MWVLKLVSSIVVFGISLLTGQPASSNIVKDTISSPPVFDGQSEVYIDIPDLEDEQSISETNTVVASGSSQINITVDTSSTNANQLLLIYPEANKIEDNKYETKSSGDDVFSWYKSELEKKGFHLNNQVRAKANDQFKGVLQGTNDSTSISVHIEQVDSASSTYITFN